MRADDLLGALREAMSLEIFHVPSDENEVEEAVVKLKAATSRPVWMDAEDAVAYEAALIEACQDYPIDVVQSACRNWRQIPNHGKWWPTEQDLRQQCQALFGPRDALLREAKRLLHTLREREKPGQERQAERRSISPYGRTKEFVDAVRKDERLGQNFVRSYLSDQTCDFTSDTIFVAYSTQAERIPQRCAWLLGKDFKDIRIVHDRDTTERCNRDQDAMGNTWKPPEQSKRRKP